MLEYKTFFNKRGNVNQQDGMHERVLGLFFGSAIGDALYMPVETFDPELIRKKHGRLTTYIRPDGHKWFNGREAGTWTDDTQLTVSVAESLIRCGKIDLDDMARCHVESVQKDEDLGFGPTTKNAIKNLAAGVHWSKSGRSNDSKHGFGNGVAMKVGPLGAYRASPYWEELWVEDRAKFITSTIRLALMTHRTRMAVDSALAHAFAIKTCLSNESFSVKEFVNQIVYWSSFVFYEESGDSKDKLSDRFVALGEVDVNSLTPKKIIELFGGGTSYICNSLPFSYAFFLRSPFSIETLFEAGNAGGDTDTNASMVGGLLGALNGISIFPRHLIDGLQQKERIRDLAERFYQRFYIIDGKQKEAEDKSLQINSGKICKPKSVLD